MEPQYRPRGAKQKTTATGNTSVSSGEGQWGHAVTPEAQAAEDATGMQANGTTSGSTGSHHQWSQRPHTPAERNAPASHRRGDPTQAQAQPVLPKETQ